jgi:hypothetical protein
MNNLELVLVLYISTTALPQMVTAQTTTTTTTSGGLSCKLQTYEFMKALDNASNEMNATKGEQLSNLRKAIHQVPKDEKLPHALHDQLSVRCSEFFWDLGDQLKSQLQRELGDEWTRYRRANQIVETIKRSPDWQKVSPEDAQKLANAGVIVEGLKHGGEGESGHVATVSPTPDNAKLQTGREKEFGPPFVRDGNEHVWSDPGKPTKVVFPSSRGAVSYARAFCEQRRGCTQPPEYYAWLPSWNAAFNPDLPPCSERQVEQAKTEAANAVPPKKVAPKGSSHTGLIILGLGGAAAAGAAAYEFGVALKNQNGSSSSSSSSSSGGGSAAGECVSTAPVNACKPCTCTPAPAVGSSCNGGTQCGGDSCWTGSTPPFC